jgi:hypothetical protein
MLKIQKRYVTNIQITKMFASGSKSGSDVCFVTLKPSIYLKNIVKVDYWVGEVNVIGDFRNNRKTILNND